MVEILGQWLRVILFVCGVGGLQLLYTWLEKKNIPHFAWLETGITISLIVITFYLFQGELDFGHWGGSALVISTLSLIVMAMTISIIGYIKIHVSDGILLVYTLFLVEHCTGAYVFLDSLRYFTVWILLCIFLLRRYKKIRDLALQLVITIAIAIISYVLFKKIFQYEVRDIYYRYAYYWHLDNLEKTLFLTGLATIFLVLFVGILFLLRKILALYIEQIHAFSQVYEEIGQYLLLIPGFFGVYLILMNYSEWRYFYQPGESSGTVMLVCLFLFFSVQIFYIRLLVQTVRLKEHLQFNEIEKKTTALYQSDMERNMKEIRQMKHDLKNIFLTMGGYVARSDDTEMKAYYYENIAPFAGNEIRKNDLYVTMQEIRNEAIRAFLYYKYLEIQNKGQELELEVYSDQSFLPYLNNPSDIIRILGIFFDNAREECAWIPDSQIHFVVKEKEGELLLLVKNPVRESVEEVGIHIGITSKGLGRGNGLEIVKTIVKKHNDILWNSYFNEGEFVQSLLLKKR
ncbi:GHKL domain-containing protein [Anaerosporobacter faecicola]|uniref:GHKL domain-containing protein n=1 Tax=Anaerosporobacter faecicola TaxID=2718714 RepID=UPI001439412A|nr:GHKL domain-containing protein [Anaerosporobacter faecicola]